MCGQGDVDHIVDIAPVGMMAGGFGEQRGHPKLVGMTASARDDEAANRLWTVSEDLTGVRYLDGPTTSSS